MRNVLIVCEELTQRDTFERVLAGRGLSVEIVDQAFVPHNDLSFPQSIVAIVDLSAKDADGFLTVLSLHRSAPKMPIVAICDHGDTVTYDHAHRCGATFCISRPLDLEALAQLVQGLFSFVPSESVPVSPRFRPSPFMPPVEPPLLRGRRGFAATN